MKVVRKFGKSSYHIILPKSEVEFYGWDERPVLVHIDSEKIVLTKLSDVKVSKRES